MTVTGRREVDVECGWRDRFERAVARILPRILTQVNRDASSPTYGCFDRNWWHYKIRDFPSVILQQGGYALAEASRSAAWQKSVEEEGLRSLAAAAARFWNERACRRGAFEEYYPWEQGYPPLAFSTLAIAKMTRDGFVDAEEVREGARVAASQLLARFEDRAGNQQVAGLAALAVLKEVFPEFVAEDGFDRLAKRTLALQHEEGWYMEYDGPDLGYLAVTLDCLWDLHDSTGEDRFLASARRALQFIAEIVAVHGASPGMLNARNTDYLVPYGIARFALEGGPAETRVMASGLIQTLYCDLDAPAHFLVSIDDRYLSHYVGHSFVRALRLFEKNDAVPEGKLPQLKEGESKFYDGCGYYAYRSATGSNLLVALKKGGVFCWSDGERSIADFGWQLCERGALHFNHWWSPDWKIKRETGEVTVSGNLFTHEAAASDPFKHLALRILSFTLGSRIIGWLKSKLIFKGSRSEIRFHRTIALASDTLIVRDSWEGPNAGDPSRAPRASKRHVSSADSYHREDLALFRGVARFEERRRDRGLLKIDTTYRLTPEAGA